MGRAYWCAYFSMTEATEMLTDEEVGRLFRALTKYAMTGEETDLPGNERFLFPSLRGQIRRDSDAYDERCEANRRNILNRWDTKNTTVYDRIPNDTKHTKEKEKEKKKENSNIMSIPFIREVTDGK